jgi:hypothetical protein
LTITYPILVGEISKPAMGLSFKTCPQPYVHNA